MSWCSEFADQITLDAPVGKRTWYRLGGRARYLFQPHDEEQLCRGLAAARQEGLPVKVLGCGANVLVCDDGFDGVVVRLERGAFRTVQRSASLVEVGAGVDLMPLSKECSLLGLSGLECMAGIPASVGGAVRMNAGGRFGEFGQVVREVRVMNPDGSVETWPHQRVGFGYRRTELDDRIVLSAQLELREDDPRRVRQRFLEYFKIKKDTQPLADQSAGCIFKNPRGQAAGALIDRAGLKRTQCGGAVVSERHANFIVARRGATASDVLRLIELIRERVHQLFGTLLETEIDIWNRSRSHG